MQHSPSNPELLRLLKEHLAFVFGYVAMRVAPDRAAAEDITQETLVAALRGWQSGRAIESMRPWLLEIARHKIADHFRGARRTQRERPLEDALALAKQCGASNEHAMVVNLALRELADEDAALLEQKYVGGMSVREIATHRGLSEKAVESSLTRARESFRQAFARLNGAQETYR